MIEDWFEEGKQKIINKIADALDEDPDLVEAVYAELVNEGLIDYDVEKEIFWEMADE